MRSIAGAHSVLMIHTAAPAWIAPYITDYEQAEASEEEPVVEAARRLAGRHRVDGILAYDEFSVEPAARAAADLGLKQNSPESVRRCRDKYLMRLTWQRAGVPSARCRRVSSLVEAEAVAQSIGFPVVVKPQRMAASLGVVRADDPEGLARAYETATDIARLLNQPQVILVEEFLNGPEFSVESLVYGGTVHTVAVTRKEVGCAPYFEETGHAVSPAESVPSEAEVLATVVSAHAALGITTGATHAEVKLTASGPRMIELGARLGGDLIPHLVQLATGVDMARAAADMAAGLNPLPLAPTRRQAAAIRFFYPRVDVQVNGLAASPAARSVPGLERLVWQARIGSKLRLPPRDFVSRLGFAVVTGSSVAECCHRLDLVEASLEMDLAPLP